MGKVVDDEDGFPSAQELLVPPIVPRSGVIRLGAGRKVDGDGRALARLAVEVDGAPMILDGSPDHGQPQAGAAAPHDLLGIEGFEDALPVLGADALAAVGHRQYHVISSGELLKALAGDVEGDAARRDDNAPPVGLGLGGVGHQVHEHLLEADRASEDQRQLPAERQFDIERRGGLEKLAILRRTAVLGDQPVEVEGLPRHHPAPGEGQEVLDDLRRPHARVADGDDDRAQRVVGGHVMEEQVGVADDTRQDVIEVVGHPSGKQAQGLHLLRTLQALLQLLALFLGEVAFVDLFFEETVGRRQLGGAFRHPLAQLVLLPEDTAIEGDDHLHEEEQGEHRAMDDGGGGNPYRPHPAEDLALFPHRRRQLHPGQEAQGDCQSFQSPRGFAGHLLEGAAVLGEDLHGGVIVGIGGKPHILDHPGRVEVPQGVGDHQGMPVELLPRIAESVSLVKEDEDAEDGGEHHHAAPGKECDLLPLGPHCGAPSE